MYNKVVYKVFYSNFILINKYYVCVTDVRLQKLLSSKQALESEVRKLKLQLNEERAARQNGVTNHHDQEYENERQYCYKVLCYCSE